MEEIVTADNNANIMGTRRFSIVGTPDYLAPEVILGIKHLPPAQMLIAHRIEMLFLDETGGDS